jgi:translation initiation factor 3 subunit C
MSRFFHGDSSSESSSSDEEDLYPEEEEEENVASDEEDSDEEGSGESEEASSDDEEGGKQRGLNRFIKGGADSESEESSDEDQVKVIKSAKDKRLEELESTVKAIENGQKINDWGSISTGMFSLLGVMPWT